MVISSVVCNLVKWIAWLFLIRLLVGEKTTKLGDSTHTQGCPVQNGHKIKCWYGSFNAVQHQQQQNKVRSQFTPYAEEKETIIPITHSCPMECWDCSSEYRISINPEMRLDTAASDREAEILSRSYHSCELPDWFISQPLLPLSHWFQTMFCQGGKNDQTGCNSTSTL